MQSPQKPQEPAGSFEAKKSIQSCFELGQGDRVFTSMLASLWMQSSPLPMKELFLAESIHERKLAAESSSFGSKPSNGHLMENSGAGAELPAQICTTQCSSPFSYNGPQHGSPH